MERHLACSAQSGVEREKVTALFVRTVPTLPYCLSAACARSERSCGVAYLGCFSVVSPSHSKSATVASIFILIFILILIVILIVILIFLLVSFLHLYL
jgi:hypothetical protein